MNLSSSKNFIIGNGINSPDGLFYVFNKKTGNKKWVPFSPPQKNKGLDVITKSFLYTNKTVANYSDSIIVCGMKYFNRIQFYNFNGFLLKSFSFDDDIMPIPGDGPLTISQNSKYYCLDLYGTKTMFMCCGQVIHSPRLIEKKSIHHM